MQITWLGYNCLRVQGKDVNILIDPFPESVGKLPRVQSDLVIVSHAEDAPEKAGDETFVIKTPGEFEIKEVFVYGVGAKTKDEKPVTLFRLNIEELSIGHIGALDHLLTEDALEILEGVDILCIPVGDTDLLAPKDAVEMISRIEPRIVIPVGYASPNVKKKLQTPADFFKQLGLPVQEVDKLKIARKDLPDEERLVYQLSVS